MVVAEVFQPSCQHLSSILPKIALKPDSLQAFFEPGNSPKGILVDHSIGVIPSPRLMLPVGLNFILTKAALCLALQAESERVDCPLTIDRGISETVCFALAEWSQ